MKVDLNFILSLKEKICSYESEKFKFKLFGGFIRDFLFPATEKLSLKRDMLKDIDIWVESKNDYKDNDILNCFERNRQEEFNFLHYFIIFLGKASTL